MGWDVRTPSGIPFIQICILEEAREADVRGFGGVITIENSTIEYPLRVESVETRQLFWYFRIHYRYQGEYEKTFRRDLRETRDCLDKSSNCERDWVDQRTNGLWGPQDFFCVVYVNIKFIWKLIVKQKLFMGCRSYKT